MSDIYVLIRIFDFLSVQFQLSFALPWKFKTNILQLTFLFIHARKHSFSICILRRTRRNFLLLYGLYFIEFILVPTFKFSVFLFSATLRIPLHCTELLVIKASVRDMQKFYCCTFPFSCFYSLSLPAFHFFQYSSQIICLIKRLYIIISSFLYGRQNSIQLFCATTIFFDISLRALNLICIKAKGKMSEEEMLYLRSGGNQLESS